MHPAQSMSTLSCSTISSLEDLLCHDDQEEGCTTLLEEDEVLQGESSFPMLYVEFDFGLLSKDHHDHDTTDDGDHESSLGPHYQYYTGAGIVNLEEWQQSDRACCGISLTNEEKEFSVSSSNQTSSQEGGEGDDSTFSSSHDGELCRQGHRRRDFQHWKQARKDILTTSKNVAKGIQSQGLSPETRRKVQRLQASGDDSVELLASPRRRISNKQTTRINSPSFVGCRRLSTGSKVMSLPSERDSVVMRRRSSTGSKRMISLTSETDSLVMSMSRLSKYKLEPQEEHLEEEEVVGSAIATDKGDGHGCPRDEQTVPAP